MRVCLSETPVIRRPPSRRGAAHHAAVLGAVRRGVAPHDLPPGEARRELEEALTIRSVFRSSCLGSSSRPWGFEFMHVFPEKNMSLLWFNTRFYVFGYGI